MDSQSDRSDQSDQSDDSVLATATWGEDERVSIPKLPHESNVSVVGLIAAEGEPTPEPQARYVSEGELGRGGMGKVISVFDRDLNRRVARKSLLDVGHASRRFVEEAQISAQLEHPNVLPVYDFGIDEGGSLFFTMKHVEEHDTLRTVIQKLRDGDAKHRAEYTFERRIQVVQQVCHALSYAHARGVNHRDVKPANVIIGPLGEVYLADWGVAALRGVASGASGAASSAANRDAHATSGATVRTVGTRLAGTMAYMSPERLAGTSPEFDPDGDVYALVAVLYEFLTLEHYVVGGATADRDEMHARLKSNRYVDAKLRSDPEHGPVPPALSHVCRRGLSRDRAERFKSARELHDALQLWFEGRAPVICPRTLIQRVLCDWGRFLNHHRLLGPVATFVTLLVVLASVAYTLVGLLR